MGPFDRLNDRAKRVLALAQDEAVRFNHNYIGTEHLLLGLVREGEGAAARALDALGVELGKVRSAVEFTIGRGDTRSTPSEITLSPRTKKVIELAIDEATKLGHPVVGTEHLLLGLVREGEGIASGILESLGLTMEKVRQQVIATLGQPEPARAAPRMTGLAQPSAAAVMNLATEQAKDLGHDWLGSEHILLGLLLLPNTAAANVLASLSVGYPQARDEVVKIVARREGRPETVTLTPRAHAIVGYAKGYGDASGRGYSAETLLLGLVVDSDGIGAKVLATLGATAQKVREALR